MQAKKWAERFTILTSMLLTTIIFVNYIVDPYAIFHHSRSGWLENTRYQNAGLIRDNLYDTDFPSHTIVIGTSMTQNFLPSDVSTILHTGPTLKLSAAGASSKAQIATTSYALQSGQVKTVLWGIGEYFAVKDPSLEAQKKSMPYALYEPGFTFGKFKTYLLNLDIFITSLNLIFGRIHTENDPDRYNTWMHEKRYKQQQKELNSCQTLKKLKAQAQHRDFHFESPVDLPAAQALAGFIISHPGTQFILFFPPYSTAFYSASNGEYLNRIFSLHRYLVKRLGSLKNVKIFAFDTKAFPGDLANYVNLQHYDANVSKTILHLISKEDGRLTMDTLPVYEKHFEDNLNSYVPHSSQANCQNDAL